MSTTAPAAAYAGQLGHLTPEQEKAFTEFKQLCAEKGIYTHAEPGENGKLASHDDILLMYVRLARAPGH